MDGLLKAAQQLAVILKDSLSVSLKPRFGNLEAKESGVIRITAVG